MRLFDVLAKIASTLLDKWLPPKRRAPIKAGPFFFQENLIQIKFDSAMRDRGLQVKYARDLMTDSIVFNVTRFRDQAKGSFKVSGWEMMETGANPTALWDLMNRKIDEVLAS